MHIKLGWFWAWGQDTYQEKKEYIFLWLVGVRVGVGWRKRQKGGIYISLQDRVSWAGGTQGVSNHVCPHHVTLPLFLCTIFVWVIVYSIIIANSICPNFKMHWFKLKKGICQKGKSTNCKMYLFELQNIFYQPCVPHHVKLSFSFCRLPTSCLTHVIQSLSIWERNW